MNRLQINSSSGSQLGQAISQLLRIKFNCVVICLSGGGGEGQREDKTTSTCDLTNNQECRRLIQEHWNEGIDIVINCEEDASADVAHRISAIGSNIQQIINVREG